MAENEDDSTLARERLLAKVKAAPWARQGLSEGHMARRIARMSDRQVLASLAMLEEAIETGIPVETEPTPHYAPGADSTEITFWYH